MTDLEDRLRAELAAFAQRADPALIRPLREPAIRARPRVPGWLAPAAAAVAVTVVVMGVAFVGWLAGHRPATGPVAGVPRYYLTLDGPWSGHFARAVVHGSATGATLASARIPLLDGESPSVTGAADGRTFIIVDNTGQAPGHGYGVRFYRLRVGPDGGTVRLSRLPIKVWPLAVDDVAVSPDGSRLAIAEQSCGGSRCRYSQIQVRSLATGATKTWRTRAAGAPWNLSWAAGGHQVGFLWESGLHSPPRPQRDGYRLLNVAGPGGDLLPAGAVLPARPVQLRHAGQRPAQAAARHPQPLLRSRVPRTNVGHRRLVITCSPRPRRCGVHHALLNLSSGPCQDCCRTACGGGGAGRPRPLRKIAHRDSHRTWRRPDEDSCANRRYARPDAGR